jgi:hypothetical protein
MAHLRNGICYIKFLHLNKKGVFFWLIHVDYTQISLMQTLIVVLALNANTHFTLRDVKKISYQQY